MICAATWSRMPRVSRVFFPASRNALSAATVERRSSQVTTSHETSGRNFSTKRWAFSAARPSVPFICFGKPTTTQSTWRSAAIFCTRRATASTELLSIVPNQLRCQPQHAIGVLHHSVIEGRSRKLREFFAPAFLESAGTAHHGNESPKLRSMPIKLGENCWHRPDEHAGIPSKISFANEGFGQLDIWFLAKTHNPEETWF